MTQQDAANELPMANELPVIGLSPVERADAARNRYKILQAAAELFERLGTENVSMDMVAEAACVGKGTLYRRFGDRAGLARAILDDHEREFQEQFIRGEPPLGPGAPPRERLIAFGAGVLSMIDRYGDLLLAAQTGAIGARFHGSVYAAYRTHLRALVAEANDALDADYFAELLLAPLAAEFVNYWRGERSFAPERLSAGYVQLVDLICG